MYVLRMVQLVGLERLDSTALECANVAAMLSAIERLVTVTANQDSTEWTATSVSQFFGIALLIGFHEVWRN